MLSVNSTSKSMLTSALDHVRWEAKKSYRTTILPAGGGGCGQQDLGFKMANDRDNAPAVRAIKPEYGAGLENQINSKPYRQIPTEPDCDKVRPPSGPCVEQRDRHLLPRSRLYILKDRKVLMYKRPEKLGEN